MTTSASLTVDIQVEDGGFFAALTAALLDADPMPENVSDWLARHAARLFTVRSQWEPQRGALVCRFETSPWGEMILEALHCRDWDVIR